jgi:hypothetical protein
MLLCIVAVHWSLSSSASLRITHLEQNAKQSHFKDYGTNGLGYWLSYPGDECLKCNCSLNATAIYKEHVINHNVTPVPTWTDFWTIFMDKSDCTGEGKSISHKCQCYGNPDILVGQVNQEVYFTGTMGDSTCFGTRYDGNGLFALTCHGQKRSETIVLNLQYY